MTTMMSEIIVKARELGMDYGKARGSWIIDGNTPKSFLDKVIDGYEENNPEVLDMCDSPLSGEFADGPTIPDVLRNLGLTIDPHCLMCEAEQAEVIDAYEHGYRDGFWDTVIQTAYRMHGDFDPCGVCGLFGHKVKDHDD